MKNRKPRKGEGHESLECVKGELCKWKKDVILEAFGYKMGLQNNRKELWVLRGCSEELLPVLWEMRRKLWTPRDGGIEELEE